MKYDNLWDIALSYKAGFYGTFIFVTILVIFILLFILFKKKFINNKFYSEIKYCFIFFEAIIGVLLTISLIFYVANGTKVYKVKKYVSNLRIDENSKFSNFINEYDNLEKVTFLKTSDDSIMANYKSGQHLFEKKRQINVHNIILNKINESLQEDKKVIISNVLFKVPKIPTKHIVPAPCFTNLKENKNASTFKNKLIKMESGIYMNPKTLQLYNIVQNDKEKFTTF